MKAFLESVAEYLYTEYKSSVSSMAIVFPNKRAHLFFNRHLQKNIEKPLITPAYYTISEYIIELSSQVQADQLTLLFELYSVYVEVTNSKESFDDFLYYCEMMLADFDDIDKYLVDARQLFQNLHDIKDMEDYFQYLTEGQRRAIERFWGTILSGKESNEQKEFTAIWEVLFRIYQRFNQVLDEKALSYEGKAYKKAIEILKNNQSEFTHSKVAFIGFNALNKCENELFRILQNRGQALFFWDYDSYYIERAEFHEAAFFLRNLIVDFPKPIGFSFESNLTDKNKTIEVIQVPGDLGQAESLKVLLDTKLLQNQEAAQDQLIALADESLLIPVLHAIPENVKELNISMGFPIKESLTFALVESLINLHSNKRNNCFFYKDINLILQNGILKRTIPSVDTKSLRNEIIRYNLIYIPTDFFNACGSQILLQIVNPEINQNNFIGYLLSTLKSLASNVSNSNSSYDVIEQEALYKIITRLNRIESILSQQTISLSFRTLLRLIGKIISGLTVPFSGEPLSGIQVMGVLESRTLDFKNVLILSLNEGVFPKSGNVPSLIPYTLRYAFELPTVEHQDAIFAYYFYRLLHRADKVTLVYNSSAEGMKTGEPSRFIQQLKYEKSFNVLEKQFAYKVQPSLNKSITIEKDARVMDLLSNILSDKEKPLSPSALNTYIACKLRFYFRYIAKIKEIEQVSEDVESDVFGNILHKILELIYSPYKGSVVNHDTLKVILSSDEIISKAIDEAFYTEFLKPSQKEQGEFANVEYTGKNILLKEAIKRYVRKLLEYDQKNTPMEILALENNFFTDIEISADKFVRIGGFIDRLDRMDGSIRVIDYKSGQVKDSFTSIEQLFDANASGRNPAVFQIFLYSLMVQKEYLNENIIPGLYFIRDIASTDFDYKIKMGLGRNKESVTSFLPFADEFRALLADKLNELLNPQISFHQTDDDKTCLYCPYNVICNR